MSRLYAHATVLLLLGPLLTEANVQVSTEFISAGFVPTVLPVPPDNILNVYYPMAEVCLGDKIPTTKSIVQPKISYNLKPGCNYTLVMIDPDTPSAQAPQLRSYLIWMIVDISQQSQGQTIADYISPIPYPGSGLHRYILLLYEQVSPINIAALLRKRLGIRRYRFDIATFAKEYGLCDPVAGNFFRSKLPALYNEYYCEA